MRSSILQTARCVALCCLFVLLLAAPSVGRKWRAKGNGFVFQAEVIAYDGKQATFEVDGANKFTVPVDRLSEEDQKYLKSAYPDGLKAPEKKDSDKKPAAKPAASPAPKPAAKPAAAKPASPRVATARPVGKAPSRSADSVQDGGMKVEVVSLTVTKKPKDEQAGMLLVPGTRFILLVSDPSRKINGLDSEKSKITACIDNKRTNLAQPTGGEADGPTVLMMEVQPGGHSGTIDLDQPQVPNPRATQILIRGELHVLCGDGDSAETVKVPLNIIVGLGL